MSDSVPTVTLQALQQLHDEQFVNGAYSAILGRPPDPGGLQNYLAQIRAGTAKTHIIAELVLSAEGRSRGLDVRRIPGLRDAIASYRKRTPSLFSRVIMRFRSRSFDESERYLRMLDNRLYLIEKTLLEQAQKLDAIQSGRNNIRAPSVPVQANIAAVEMPAFTSLTPNTGRIVSEIVASVAAVQSK